MSSLKCVYVVCRGLWTSISTGNSKCRLPSLAGRWLWILSCVVPGSCKLLRVVYPQPGSLESDNICYNLLRRMRVCSIILKWWVSLRFKVDAVSLCELLNLIGGFFAVCQMIRRDCLWMGTRTETWHSSFSLLTGDTWSNGLSLPAFLDGRLMSLLIDIIGKWLSQKTSSWETRIFTLLQDLLLWSMKDR